MVYVKYDLYRRVDLMMCNSFISGDVSIKKIVIVMCNIVFEGKFFEIVVISLLRIILKVFEIECFGKYKIFVSICLNVILILFFSLILFGFFLFIYINLSF